MIVLSCKYCGSHNLSPGKYSFEAVCECGKELHLWEMRHVYVSTNGAKPLTNVSEQAEQNLTQHGQG